MDESLDAPVGFTWWKKPDGELTFYEKWLSLCKFLPCLCHLVGFPSGCFVYTWSAYLRPRPRLTATVPDLSPLAILALIHLAEGGGHDSPSSNKNRGAEPPRLTMNYVDAWFAPMMRAYVAAKMFFLGSPFPVESLNTFARVVGDLEPQYLDTPRRRNAWYLSTIAVHPLLQGRQLGDVLVRDGLELVDRTGSASYLIGLRSVEQFYPRYGFKEVCRANVGELSDWDGGSIMFRE